MAHTITLTDDEYAQLEAAAERLHTTTRQLLVNWLSGLSTVSQQIEDDEYTRRWEAFWPLVGSIQQGKALTNEEIDELIGEEAADPHADASA